MEGLVLSELASIPELKKDLVLCLWVQTVDQTLEVGLGDLVPAGLLSRPLWVGSCLIISYDATIFQEWSFPV